MSKDQSKTKSSSNEAFAQTQSQQQQQQQDQSQIQAQLEQTQQQQQQGQQQTSQSQQQQTQQQIDQQAQTQAQSQAQSQAQTQAQRQSTATNNLAYLQPVWGAALNLLTGLNPANSNTALDALSSAAGRGTSAAGSGLDAISALTGGGVTNGANSYLTPIANGSQVGAANPGFGDMVKQIGMALQPQVDGAFGAAGRYGSGANANAFADNLTKEVGNLAYQNYGDSQQRQLTAAGQLSQNNTNSTNAVLQALGLIPTVAGSGVSSAQAGYGGATAPLNTVASILASLGSGGETTSGVSNGATSGVSNGVTNGSSTGSSAATNNTTSSDITNAILQLLSSGSTAGLAGGSASGSMNGSSNGTVSGTDNKSGQSSTTSTGFKFSDLFSPMNLLKMGG